MCNWVDLVVYGLIGLFVTIDSVLGSEECDQLNIGRATQYLDSADPIAIYTGWMRQKSHSFTCNCAKTGLFQYINAEINTLCSYREGTGRKNED